MARCGCGRRNGYDCFRCIHESWCNREDGKDLKDGRQLTFKTRDEQRRERENAAYLDAVRYGPWGDY